MDPNKNPFHKWLGLDPRSNNPHHFKLLGVSPKLTQQSEIETAVKAGVKRNLGLLAKVPAGQNDQTLAKLKARISTAEQILLDPKLRGQYKLKLKAQIQASRSSKIISEAISDKAQAPASGKPNSDVRQADLVPPTNQPIVPPASTQPPSAVPIAQPAPQPPEIGGPVAPVSATPPASPVIPPGSTTPLAPPAAATPPANQLPATQAPMQAVPMAVPLNSQPPMMASPAPAHPLNAMHNQPVAEASFEEPAFKIRKIKRKKRSKLAGPLIALLMLGSAAGGSYLIYQNFDEVNRLFNPNDETESTEPAGTNTSPKRQPDGERADPAIAAVAPEPTDPENGSGRKPEAENPAEASTYRPLAAPRQSADQNVSTTEVKPGTRLVSLDQGQLSVIRRDIERGYRSLFRRENALAEECFGSASAFLDSVVGNDAQLVAEQQSLADRIHDFPKLKTDIEGFWDQVKKSADSISGGTEIAVGSQIASFLESKPESVILRRMGANIEYSYSFCPSGLAVVLAERGMIEDIPTWNMQKAAFTSIDQMRGINHSAIVDKYLAIAEDAGHDCSYLRRIKTLNIDIGRPENKLEPASEKDLHPATDSFRKTHDYREPKKLDKNKALELAGELFIQTETDVEQRLALLEEVRLLAIQAGSASIAEDAIYEIEVFGEINRGQVTCKTFENIARKKLEPLEARQLIERAIGFLKSELATSAKKNSRFRLKDRLFEHAERHEMHDALRRLKQIEI